MHQENQAKMSLNQIQIQIDENGRDTTQTQETLGNFGLLERPSSGRHK